MNCSVGILVERLISLVTARKLAPKLIEQAQTIYDAWDETDVDIYADGGICHLIAEALVEVLAEADIEAQTIVSSFETHVFVVCQLADGIYSLDIPYLYYEVGGGYLWRKLPNVRFEPSNLEWYRLDTDPSRYDQYAADC